MAKRGPKTRAGKEIVRLNAVKHGVLSATPVIPFVEREEDWEAHRAGVLSSLAPEGHLEETLSGRIALLLWRRQRLERYEREIIALAQEEVERDVSAQHPDCPTVRGDRVPGLLDMLRVEIEVTQEGLALLQRLETLPDDTHISSDDAIRILDAVADETEDVDLDDVPMPGVPDGVLPEDFAQWTAGLVREGIRSIAAHSDSESDPDALYAAAISTAQKQLFKARSRSERLAADIDHMRRRRLLPIGPQLDQIMRYEAHLSRQLRHDLHELEALQARRQGGVAPLARVDVQGLPEG
jgi:hypothetical protein